MKQAKPYTEAGQALNALFEKRIVFLDGAMGTMVQKYRLQEADYRGSRFMGHPSTLR